MEVDFISVCTYNYVHMEMKWQNMIKNAQIPVFKRGNLSVVLGQNRRTLDGRLLSFVTRGLLTPLKKGVYLNKYFYDSSPDKEEVLEYAGSVLVFPSYLSLEYVLAKRGVLAESVNTFTYITTKKTRRFETAVGTYTYRSIKDALFSDYEEIQYDSLKYNVAKTYKALFDFIYFAAARNTLELKMLLLESRLNWDILDVENKEAFVKLILQVGAPKMLRVLKILRKERIL